MLLFFQYSPRIDAHAHRNSSSDLNPLRPLPPIRQEEESRTVSDPWQKVAPVRQPVAPRNGQSVALRTGSVPLSPETVELPDQPVLLTEEEEIVLLRSLHSKLSGTRARNCDSYMFSDVLLLE